jgi:hypothetical protein
LLQTALERNQSMTDIVDEAIKVYLNITLNQGEMPESNELIASDALIDAALEPIVESTTMMESPAIAEPSQVTSPSFY